MEVKSIKRQRWSAASALLGGLGLSLAFSFGAEAQVLSSPMGTPPAAAGQGPGVHDPNRAFPPLVPRADVVSWSVLTDVSVQIKKPRVIATFSEGVKKLRGTTVKIQGYMTPLEPGTQHSHFLLLSLPPTCPFCVPGGAESMVEVRTAAPVKYSQNVLVVQGRLQVLEQDPQGLYYRMTSARVVK